MYLKSNILYFHVDTPLHVGAGSGLGAIDLPIQRERSTGYPMIQASGIKGALRDALRSKLAKAEIEAVFGPWQVSDDENPNPETENAPSQNKAHAGAFSPGDARILLFPVRSLKGVFAWTTSANVLQRWAREVREIAELEALDGFIGPVSTEDNEYCFTGSDAVVTSDGSVVLEDFAFERQEEDISDLAEALAKRIFPEEKDQYWKDLLKSNLVVLPDDDFTDFVTYTTDVITRTRIEPDSKTVVRGALWTEEHLPVDTVLYTPIRATRIRMNAKDIPEVFQGSSEEQAQKVLKWLKDNIGDRIQLGGDETVGRGLVGLHWEL